MIFFDIDDTLTDSVQAHRLAITKLANQQDLPIRHVTAAQHRWMAITDGYLDRFFRKELSAQEQRKMRLVDFWKTYDRELTSYEATLLYPEYHHYFLHHCLLFPDVAEALNKVAHYPLGIISNGIFADQQFKLEHNRIQSAFSPIVISEDVGFAKPAPVIFETALQRANQPRSLCYYIGNSYQLDYLGAKQAGLYPILIDRGNEYPQVSDTHRCASFAEAIDLILANPLTTA